MINVRTIVCKEVNKQIAIKVRHMTYKTIVRDKLWNIVYDNVIPLRNIVSRGFIK